MPTALEEPRSKVGFATPTKSVLVVDDSPFDRRLAGRIIESSVGLTPLYAGNGREALELLERESPAAVLTDMQMPEIDGLELVNEVRSRYPGVPVVLMTAHGSEEIAILALQAGAASYVPKRALSSDLIRTLKQVLDVAAVDRAPTPFRESSTPRIFFSSGERPRATQPAHHPFPPRSVRHGNRRCDDAPPNWCRITGGAHQRPVPWQPRTQFGLEAG
jgi:CheY-like chemotaxis protein